MQIKNSLKNKSTLFIFSTVLTTGFLSVLFLYLYIGSFLEDREIKSLETVAIEQSYEVLGVMEHSSGIISKIVGDSDIIRYFEDENREKQDANIVKILNRFNIGGSYRSISLLSKDGDVLSTTDALLSDKSYATSEFFKMAINGSIYTDVFVNGRDGGRLSYYFSYPVVDYREEILGVAVLELDDTVVGEVIRLFRKNEKIQKIYIVDEYGVVVYSSDKNDFLKSVINLSFSERLEIKSRKNIDVSLSEDLIFISNKEFLLDIKGRESQVVEFVNRDGASTLVGLSKLEAFPFFVAVEVNKEEIISATRSVASYLLFAVLLLALGNGFVIQFAIRGLLDRIVKIDKIVKKVAEGDLSQRVGFSYSDEVGSLAKNLDLMIGEMQKNFKNIDSVVQERTKLLEKTNDVLVGRELKMMELKEKLKKAEEGGNKQSNLN